MPNGSEPLPFAAAAPNPLATRIATSLAEGGYAPSMTIVRPGADLAEALCRSQARIVFASAAAQDQPIAELLRSVREYDRALPVVMVAEPREEESAIEAMRAGARDYVVTDHLHRLPAIVERELREAEWRREHVRFEARLQETQRLESIGLLAGGVAHDFNNLLTGIPGNSSMALDAVPRSSPARKM